MGKVIYTPVSRAPYSTPKAKRIEAFKTPSQRRSAPAEGRLRAAGKGCWSGRWTIPRYAEVLRSGISEYVGAADRIIEALRLAPSVSPLGNAMICGCADWARAGVRSSAPGRLLRDLAAPHLSARQRARFTGHAYDEALAWATREINATVSLLQPEPDDGYTVTDFALDLISERVDPVPDVAWALAIGNAGPGT